MSIQEAKKYRRYQAINYNPAKGVIAGLNPFPFQPGLVAHQTAVSPNKTAVILATMAFAIWTRPGGVGWKILDSDIGIRTTLSIVIFVAA